LCTQGAKRARRISVALNVASYILLMIGQIPMGALLKLVAEFLRLPYFYYTEAWDMVWLAFFFIVASFITIAIAIV
jgi:hypothetical protein